MYNDAEIVRGAMNLVPDLRSQLIEDALFKQQQTAFQQQQEDRAAAMAAAQEQQRRGAEFQAALDEAMMSGDPRAIQRLRLRFPEFAKPYKEAFDAMDADARRADLTQIGSIYARVNAGDPKGAANILRQRIEADRAAGQADPQDEAILAELESGDPMRVNVAKGAIGIMLAAVEPDKFGETYGKLNPTEATPATIREYDARVAKFGKAAADNWLATQDTKLVPVQPGGTVFEFGGGTTGGGDPVSSGGGAPVSSGAPSLSVDQFRANAEVLGPDKAARMTARNGIPVAVRSVQEANSLPPGTLYVTPTGEMYTR